jgi:hypothetical protein
MRDISGVHRIEGGPTLAETANFVLELTGQDFGTQGRNRRRSAKREIKKSETD